VKVHRILLTGLVLAGLSPLAAADLAQTGQEIKQDAKQAAHKTAKVAKEVGHATAHAAKTVGHDVADAARKGYKATKNVFEKKGK
jgi:hypothetical protein